MISLQEFLEIWNGEYCEVAGSTNAKNQCLDLANAYLRDVRNHPIVEWTNAVDFPSKIKDMEWIVNDEITDLPKEGDIVIWNSSVGGGAGHIAIFLDGTTTKFNSFDQNWPLSSPCHIQSHTYSNVSGWLRPKSIIEGMTEEQKRILQFLTEQKANEGKVREAFGALASMPVKDEQIGILTQKVVFYERRISELEVVRVELVKEIDENKETIANQQDSIASANDELRIKKEELDKVTTERNDYRRRYENLLDNTVDKLSSWELLKLSIKKLFIKK